MKAFKERRAEREFVKKKLIEERAAQYASRPRPQWNSTTSNNNTIGANVESEAADDRHHAKTIKDNDGVDESKKDPKKIRKYSKPRPHQLFPKSMQKKDQAGWFHKGFQQS